MEDQDTLCYFYFITLFPCIYILFYSFVKILYIIFILKYFILLMGESTHSLDDWIC